MNWFKDHPVLIGLVCSGVAVAYGLYLTQWLLKLSPGNERMREISRAVQEGAAAYLKKQYTTIAVVAIVPFILLGVYDKLGWGPAFGFLIGATLSAAAGFIGMNVAVRSNSRTAEAARGGLAPALNVGDCAGMAADLFETYAVTAVAVMLLGTLAGLQDVRLYLFPLAIGGVSAVSSVIGTFFARLGRGENAVINALYKAVLVATLLSAIGFIPITIAFDGGKYGFGDLYISSIIGLVVTFLLVAITEYYTGTRWNPVKAIAKA